METSAFARRQGQRVLRRPQPFPAVAGRLAGHTRRCPRLLAVNRTSGPIKRLRVARPANSVWAVMENWVTAVPPRPKLGIFSLESAPSRSDQRGHPERRRVTLRSKIATARLDANGSTEPNSCGVLAIAISRREHRSGLEANCWEAVGSKVAMTTERPAGGERGSPNSQSCG